MDALLQQVNQYCERQSIAFWAEPLNAISNLSFIIAGVIAIRLTHKNHQGLTANVLAYMICVIGIGSFLFHTYATRWAELADVFPIYIFQLIYTGAFSRYCLKFDWPKTLAVYGLYIATTLASGYLPWSLNGSIMYLPTILMLIFFAVMLKWQKADRELENKAWSLVVFFCLSLTARTVDASACNYLPRGTHFIWHILNGLILYISWSLISSCQPAHQDANDVRED